jgi:hypothetical protein
MGWCDAREVFSSGAHSSWVPTYFMTRLKGFIREFTMARLVIRQYNPNPFCLIPNPNPSIVLPKLRFQLDSVSLPARCEDLPSFDFRFVGVE